jgi:isoquinoline 1-oxidoreductase beta subunit
VWGPSPYPETSEALLASVAASFNADQQDSRNKDDGDVDAALAAARALVIKAEYRVPYLAHAPLEPTTAVVQLKDGLLDIWSGTQIPRFLVDGVAGVTGIDSVHIRLHVLMMGGSLGGPAGRR